MEIATYSLPKSEFPAMLNKALHILSDRDESNIKSGFRATGIFPQNRNEVLKRIRGEPLTVEPNAINESFVDFMRNATAVIDRPAAKRSKKINVEAGKSVRPEDLQQPGTSSRSPLAEMDENIQQSEQELEGMHEDSISDDPQSETSEEEAEPHDENRNQKALKVALNKSNASEIVINRFVIVEFPYSCGKKQSKKPFVAKVLETTNSNVVVTCLRQYSGSKDTFVFPVLEDIAEVKVDAIKFLLSEPHVQRGRYKFMDAVI